MKTYTEKQDGTEWAGSEGQLVAAASGGDTDAFGIIFEQNKRAVYSLAIRSTRNPDEAEDIVQRTFIKAWQSMADFRGDSKLLTWLCAIAANICRDHARMSSRRVRTVNEEEFEGLHAHPTGDIEGQCINKQAIEDALAGLPVSHRMLVVLCDMQGLTSKEAAKVLGCSPISARVRLSRAHEKLRMSLSPVLE